MTMPSKRPQPTSAFQRCRRALTLLVHVLQVRISLAWARPGCARQARARSWARRALDILNVQVVVGGSVPRSDEAALIVANHISWLDIHALGAVTGARFVAKSEVRGWPIVGSIAARDGTLFIRRGSCRDAWRTKNHVAAALRGGERVAVFPEGTTTNGRHPQPFRAALLQAAVDSATAVYPVSIRYQTLDGSGNAAAAFVGEMTFIASLRRVLREPVMAVEVHFGERIVARHRTRRELAALAQLAITKTLTEATEDRLTHALWCATAARNRKEGTRHRTFRGTPAGAPA